MVSTKNNQAMPEKSADYREIILKDAKKCQENQDYSNALIFYAFYFEHEINGLIRFALEQKGFKEEDMESLMRLSVKAKISWLADLLNLKRPNQQFVNFLIPFLENRSRYMHLRGASGEARNNQSQTQLKRQLDDIEKQVAYLKTYVRHG